MADCVKITKRAVDALKPTGVRSVVWDSEAPGFGVRVGTSESKTDLLKYRGGGRAARVRWGVIGQHGALTPDQAREIAQRWAAGVAAGGDQAGGNPRAALGVGRLAGGANLKDPWGLVRRAAVIPDVRPHDLRDSFASVMAACVRLLLFLCVPKIRVIL